MLRPAELAHPFWDPARRQWINAVDLQTGELLGVEMPHAQVLVGDVHGFTGQRTMYNLTVADVHTYYVMAGNTPVLVHNCGEEDTVSIYKAAKAGTTEDIMTNGFNPADFPGSGNGYPDGRAYFGVHDVGRDIALDYASRGSYDNAVIHIRIPRAEFEEHFGQFVGRHNGVPNSEVGIPNTMFDRLNSYPRELITQ